ncbi:MAG TPA: NAD(P)H-dependent oxidoreductase [Azospirillum sp.]|nr:NAD(P)H-dependent oxidoreductase [Azospirillum sp.]
MASNIRVLGFAGSLRERSNNRALLRVATEVVPEGMELEVFDLAPIPLYNGDVEAAGLPDPVRAFRERIRAADALLIACPEYNYSIPGVLKNAIDWASRPPEQPFVGKPLAFMGAGGGLGTARSQYHLRQVCVFLDMHPLNKPEVMVRNAESFNPDGTLKDEGVRTRVAALLTALAAWTRRLKGE